MTDHSSNSARGVAWDLSDLYAGVDDPKIEADLGLAHARAQAFETKYRNKINSLTSANAGLLLESIAELESVYEQMDKPATFAGLLHAAKSDEPRHGALLARTRERRTEINKHLLFFDLEWIALPDAAAKSLVGDARLARYRHWLEQKRLWKAHYLSEPEEKVLDEKNVTGKAAFGRLFEETLASMTFRMGDAGGTPSPPSPHPRGGGEGGDKTLSLQEILAKLYDPDRSTRKAAAEGISKGLNDNARVLTFIFNTIVVDHDSDTRLRSFSSAIASRNLANEIDGKVVEALMGAAERHFSLVGRYYRLKAKLLGIDKLYDYDRYAPLFSDMPACDWPSARRIVQESYEAFSPDAGAIIRTFFDKRWIDAELRPGKRGGAFSSSAVPSVHPYILMNFTERVRDVMTLAHELGHGLHQYLSRPIGYLQCDTPLTTAETASVFGEMLVFQRLQQIYQNPKERLAMLCGKIEDSFATVFRQVVLTRFELELHKLRKEKGEFNTSEVNALWLKTNRAMFGDSLELTDDYGCWWLYIGHFIRSPFYCYAYAFGELLVLALVQKYRQEGSRFVPKYLDLLASGGSSEPHVLLAKLGVDVNDPSFWELGLKLLGGMVSEAEVLALGAS